MTVPLQHWPVTPDSAYGRMWWHSWNIHLYSELSTLQHQTTIHKSQLLEIFPSRYKGHEQRKSCLKRTDWVFLSHWKCSVFGRDRSLPWMVFFMLQEVGKIKLHLQIIHLAFQSSCLSLLSFFWEAEHLVDINNKIHHRFSVGWTVSHTFPSYCITLKKLTMFLISFLTTVFLSCGCVSNTVSAKT